MRIPWRLFSKRHEPLPLGLADPAHPARKWIDAATVIADRRLDIKLVGGRPAIETNAGALRDLVGALDLALAEAPDDPDLLAARAAVRHLLHESSQANEDLGHALRIDPHHIEASALRKHGDKWNNLLFLPSWSCSSRLVHPVLAAKANQGDALHCVRHNLQAALVLLLIGTSQEYPDAPARYRWEIVCSATPFGPIGAHYVLLDVGGKIRRQEFILAPSTERNGPSGPPSSLLGRLPSVRTCFIVLAEPSGQVLHSLQYDLSREVRSVLSKLTRQLSDAAGTDSAVIRNATEWHMQHF
ncbi:MAG: hypothetical protein E4G89_01095, partial [Methanothrix sp.]